MLEARVRYRCPHPRCGVAFTALGNEIDAFCDGGGRHKIAYLQPVTDCDSIELPVPAGGTLTVAHTSSDRDG